MRFFICLLALLLVCGCSTLAYSISITQVSVNSRLITDPASEKLGVTFILSDAARVNLNIYDARDLLIRTVSSEETLKSGNHMLEWNLRDASKKAVPPGVYHYTLEAISLTKDSELKTQKSEIRTVYDLTDLTGNKRVSARQVRLAKENKGISYVLPSSSLVSVRVGLKEGGPLMKTLVDWLPRPAGKNLEHWDGMDESGFINLADHPQRDIAIMAYEFPDNAILVGSIIEKRDFANLNDNQLIKRKPQSGTKNRFIKMVPTRQAPNQLGDVQLKLTLAETFRKNRQGEPVVDGRVAFRLDVAKNDREKTANLRYEAAFFVDGLKVYENEIGYLPMTWYWDTENVNPGSHFITANLIGYEGSFGIQTMKVEVK